jgi:dynactin-5
MSDLMYCPTVHFSGDDFIVTSTRNIISRRCTVEKPSALAIPSGRCYIGHGVTIRADLAPVQIHKYTFIGEGTTLRPCNVGARPVPLTIGPHCSLGKHCTVEAAVIGAGCTVDDNCTLSPRCILKDYVHVVAGTVVPPDMVCPPFSVIAGAPARIVGDVPEGAATLVPISRENRYKALTLLKPGTTTTTAANPPVPTKPTPAAAVPVPPPAPAPAPP